VEPPDPISNSEVKRLSADDSVGSPHVKVGHCQALNPKTPKYLMVLGGFSLWVCSELRESRVRAEITKAKLLAFVRLNARSLWRGLDTPGFFFCGLAVRS
jgi:hypothetical protein